MNMCKTISVINQKGGVGKTTITFNLAKGLSKRAHRILAIDNDPQGNLTGAFLEDPTTLGANILDIYNQEGETPEPHSIEENLSLIGANIHLSRVSDSDFEVIFRLKEGLDRIRDDYDFILVDCLPSFGYLNMAALTASDQVLIPTKPAPFALAGMKDLFDTVFKTQRRINRDLQILGIVLNLVEGRQTTIATELEEVLRQNYGDLVFKTKINKAVKLEESPSFGQSIMEYDSNGKSATQFNEFLEEFLERL